MPRWKEVEMQREMPLGSTGLIGQIEVLARSGCHTNPEGRVDPAGHRWVPDRHEKYASAVEFMGWHDAQDCPLERAEWAFDPSCKDCVRQAKKYLTKRGVTTAQWSRICEVLMIRQPRKRDKYDETPLQLSRYGIKANGQYGKLTPSDMARGGIAENKEAGRILRNRHKVD
jgi:hypothetical protein